NAGGLNPRAAVQRCGSILVKDSLPSVPVSMMAEDDVLANLMDWSRAGINLDHMESGEPIKPKLGQFVSANAYLGARPIAKAHGEGARLIVTGRVADASLTLGPAASHFGWNWSDMTRLAG